MTGSGPSCLYCNPTKGTVKMSLCTDRTIVNRNLNEGTAHALKCKRWSCEFCNPDCRRNVIARAREGLPNVFLTLTCQHKNYETPDEAARDMKRALVLFRKKLARSHGVEKMPFIVVYEKHKSGWPHMHLLCRLPFIHISKLKRYWNDIIGAFQVDIRFIRKKSQVLFYVTKYIGKDLEAFKGCKRWWRSHNYTIDKDEKEPVFMYGDRFEIVNLDFLTYQNSHYLNGMDIEREGRNKIRFRRRNRYYFDPDHLLLNQIRGGGY